VGGRTLASEVGDALPGVSSGQEPVAWAIRAGFIARGLTYALIGGIAIALAVGAGRHGTAPNQEGALALVARAPLGRIALVAIAVGLAAYALWKLYLAARGVGPEGAQEHRAFDRVANAAGGLVYVGFCALAVRVLIGSAGNQTRQQKSTTSGLLHMPAGRLLVGAAAVVFIVICIYQAWEAVSGGFTRGQKTEEMSRRERRVFVWSGRAGLFARAFVFAVSGYFLLRSAIDGRVSRGIGLDGALAELHAQPFGNLMLCLTGAGLFVFAAYSVHEARRRRL
jgi:hypothetical protein